MTSAFYTIDTNNKWKNYHIDKLSNKASCNEVANQCLSDSRTERLKSMAAALAAVGSALVLSFIATRVAFVSAVLIAGLAHPLAVVPPLYGMAIVAGGLGAGLGFAFLTMRISSCALWDSAKKSWAYSNHLYQQSADAKLKATELK